VEGNAVNVFSIVLLGLTFLIALSASWALLAPFFRVSDQRGTNEDDFEWLDSPLGDLLARRETLMNSLTELEFDHRGKKISDDYYAAMKGRLTEEISACIQQIAELESRAANVVSGSSSS